MGKSILLIVIVFVLGFLILNFMPVQGDAETIESNNIYIEPYKGLDEKRVMETEVISESKTEGQKEYAANDDDITANFDESIDADVREYNALMIEYASRYAAAANELYQPPGKVSAKAVFSLAKQEMTPDPSYAVIWQGYWSTLIQMKSKWMDIRYTDVDVNLGINGNTDGPLQMSISYGRNNPAIKDELGIVGTTAENPRKERLNASLYGDRFNALDSMNMTTGELARVMAQMPEGECSRILSECNSYGVIMLMAYAHNFGEGVFTHPDNKDSIASYGDFSKIALYKFSKEVSENPEIRKILEDEIEKQGVKFSIHWNDEVSAKIFKYYVDHPIGDAKMDTWINKTYNAVSTKTQWYTSGGISCAHRLFYGINAYAIALWLEKYTSGELTM